MKKTRMQHHLFLREQLQLARATIGCVNDGAEAKAQFLGIVGEPNRERTPVLTWTMAASSTATAQGGFSTCLPPIVIANEGERQIRPHHNTPDGFAVYKVTKTKNAGKLLNVVLYTPIYIHYSWIHSTNMLIGAFNLRHAQQPCF